MRENARERELLHVKEAADAVRVHEATIYRAIQDGQLRALRLGEHGRYRIRRTDLDAFLVEAAVKVRTS
jgi:excisionase family DNA binding protein